MNYKTKKKTLTITLLLTILFVSAAYALLTATHTFTNILTVTGVGVELHEWVDNTVNPTNPLTRFNWSEVARGETYYLKVVLHNTGTYPVSLSFQNTFPPEIATVKIQIHYDDTSQWTWIDWEQAIKDKHYFIPGHLNKPIEVGQWLGLETVGDRIGNVRVALTVNANASFGDVGTYKISVVATECT